jgi:hypothetical protein
LTQKWRAQYDPQRAAKSHTKEGKDKETCKALLSHTEKRAIKLYYCPETRGALKRTQFECFVCWLRNIQDILNGLTILE